MLSIHIVRNEPLEPGSTVYTYRWVAMENYTEIERGTVTHDRGDGWRELVRKVVDNEE